MKFICLLGSLAFLLAFSSLQAKETITFLSKDGLQITADTYIDATKNTAEKNRPIIVLFHQAGWSRGEYNEIAPKLNRFGFNAMAVDLRSGKFVNGVINQTAAAARKLGKGMRYIDALADMESALLEAKKLTPSGTKIIAWGSSYSSALVLQLIGDKPSLADAVLSFSPGEYFKKSGKPANWVRQSAQSIEVPVFIASARSEKHLWAEIFEQIKSKHKIGFIPQTKGHHGSRALWHQFSDSDVYWKAVVQFLNNLK